MSHEELRSRLQRHVAQLEGQRRRIGELREELHHRSREQLDTMDPVIQGVGDHVEADVAGGVMGQRQYETLLHERRRLAELVERTRG